MKATNEKKVDLSSFFELGSAMSWWTERKGSPPKEQRSEIKLKSKVKRIDWI